MLKKLATATLGFAVVSSLQIVEEPEVRSLSSNSKPDFSQLTNDPDIQTLMQDESMQKMINAVSSGQSIDYMQMTQLLTNPAVERLVKKAESGEMGDLSSLMSSFGAPDLLMASHPDFHLNGMPAINEAAADVIGKFLDKKGSEMVMDF
eukprot:70195_1